MTPWFRQALERALFIDPRKPRVASVSLPTTQASATVLRRAREHAAVTLMPISIAVPRKDTAQDARRFALAQFTPKARRLAR